MYLVEALDESRNVGWPVEAVFCQGHLKFPNLTRVAGFNKKVTFEMFESPGSQLGLQCIHFSMYGLQTLIDFVVGKRVCHCEFTYAEFSHNIRVLGTTRTQCSGRAWKKDLSAAELLGDGDQVQACRPSPSNK